MHTKRAGKLIYRARVYRELFVEFLPSAAERREFSLAQMEFFRRAQKANVDLKKSHSRLKIHRGRRAC